MAITATRRLPRDVVPVRDRRAIRLWSLGVGAWATLIAGAIAWGRLIAPPDRRDLTQPLVGALDLRLSGWTMLAVAGAGVAVAAAVSLRRLRSFRSVLVASFGLGAAWAVALALADGPAALTAPLRAGQDYLAALPLAGDPGEFVRTFTERIARYPVHVEGHPPGTVLVLWGLDAIGLGGAGVAAALAIGAGASAVPAVLLAAREVAGESAARRTAPFLVLAPFALWTATSMDGLYLGVGAWAAALLVLGTGRSGRPALLLGVGGGALFGLGLLLSYGLVLVALVPLAVAARRRRLDVLAVAATGALAPLAAAAVAGFWWPAGLLATRERYALGIARLRPYGYFLVANLAALAVALGPAAAAGLARLRDRRLWLLSGGALAGVAIADLSGLSKAEVERIWLPFMPWALLAAAALPERGRPVWLAAQSGLAVALQIGWRSLW